MSCEAKTKGGHNMKNKNNLFILFTLVLAFQEQFKLKNRLIKILSLFLITFFSPKF